MLIIVKVYEFVEFEKLERARKIQTSPMLIERQLVSNNDGLHSNTHWKT